MEIKGNAIIMKSDIINAILPKFLKHLFYNSIIFIILTVIYYLVNLFVELEYKLLTILGFLGITIIISLIKISDDLIRNYSTTYTFYSNHFEVEYKFVTEDTHSINYSQITDIKISKTFWDRICNVGDIVIHTANDTYENESAKPVILKDIKNPNKVEDELTKKIHSYPQKK